MAEGNAGQIPLSHFIKDIKKDKGRDQAVLKLIVARRNVRKEDVDVTYPTNKDEDLVLKVNDEVYYRGRLPDTVIIDQCKVKRVSQRRGESRIKILLTKENSGLWLPGWLIEA